MSQVFPKVYVFPIQSIFQSPSITTNTTNLPASTVSNIILIATKNPDKGRYNVDEIRRGEELEQQKQQEQFMLQHHGMTSNNDNGRLNDNNIDYAAHVYNSTNIRIDDVPLLTDQFAPVENLLNPITGKPYTVDKQNPTNWNIDLNSTEGTLFALIVPSIVAGTWIFYMQTKIWKIGKMRKL